MALFDFGIEVSVLKVARILLKKSGPWLLASAPAAIALLLPGLLPTGDLRTSGAMTLFAVTPASLFVLLLIARPWLARTMAIRLIGATSLLALMVLALGAAVEGTPEFLKEQFGLFIGIDDYGPRSVITTPGGYVAVGDDAAKNAVVWVSEDGERWSRIPHSDVLTDLEIGDAAYTEFGIVMVGQDEKSGQPVALTSTDGNQWIRAASFGPDAMPRALAHNGTNLVFIGSTYQNDSAFWFSNNPNTWVVGEPAPVFDTGKVPADVIFLDGLFLAANNMESERSAFLFTSESGQTWSEIVRFNDAEISSLARYRQGAVAAGFDYAKLGAAIWVSTDGASWIQLPVTETFKGASIDIVVANGAILFAFGHSLKDNTVLVWSSIDTVTWERVPFSFGDALIRHAVMTDSGIVAVGLDLRSNYAAFWTSFDGNLWRRVVSHDNALFLVR